MIIRVPNNPPKGDKKPKKGLSEQLTAEPPVDAGMQQHLYRVQQFTDALPNPGYGSTNTVSYRASDGPLVNAEMYEQALAANKEVLNNNAILAEANRMRMEQAKKQQEQYEAYAKQVNDYRAQALGQQPAPNGRMPLANQATHGNPYGLGYTHGNTYGSNAYIPAQMGAWQPRVNLSPLDKLNVVDPKKDVFSIDVRKQNQRLPSSGGGSKYAEPLYPQWDPNDPRKVLTWSREPDEQGVRLALTATGIDKGGDIANSYFSGALHGASHGKSAASLFRDLGGFTTSAGTEDESMGRSMLREVNMQLLQEGDTYTIDLGNGIKKTLSEVFEIGTTGNDGNPYGLTIKPEAADYMYETDAQGKRTTIKHGVLSVVDDFLKRALDRWASAPTNQDLLYNQVVSGSKHMTSGQLLRPAAAVELFKSGSRMTLLSMVLGTRNGVRPQNAYGILYDGKDGR